MAIIDDRPEIVCECLRRNVVAYWVLTEESRDRGWGNPTRVYSPAIEESSKHPSDEINLGYKGPPILHRAYNSFVDAADALIEDRTSGKLWLKLKYLQNSPWPERNAVMYRELKGTNAPRTGSIAPEWEVVALFPPNTRINEVSNKKRSNSRRPRAASVGSRR